MISGNTSPQQKRYPYWGRISFLESVLEWGLFTATVTCIPPNEVCSRTERPPTLDTPEAYPYPLAQLDTPVPEDVLLQHNWCYFCVLSCRTLKAFTASPHRIPTPPTPVLSPLPLAPTPRQSSRPHHYCLPALRVLSKIICPLTQLPGCSNQIFSAHEYPLSEYARSTRPRGTSYVGVSKHPYINLNKKSYTTNRCVRFSVFNHLIISAHPSQAMPVLH